MSETGLREALEGRRKKRSRGKKGLIVLSLVFLAAVYFVVPSVLGNKKQDEAASSKLAAPSYQYSYLGPECKGGMDKYNEVSKQIKAQLDKLSGLLKNEAWRKNLSNLFIAQSVLESNKKISDSIPEKYQKLQDCLASVSSKADFTQDRITELQSIFSNIPQAVSQPTEIGGDSFSTFAYQPIQTQRTTSSQIANNDKLAEKEKKVGLFFMQVQIAIASERIIKGTPYSQASNFDGANANFTSYGSTSDKYGSSTFESSGSGLYVENSSLGSYTCTFNTDKSRLSYCSYSGGSLSFSYIGNRLASISGSVSSDYSYIGDKLVNASSFDLDSYSIN